MRDEVVYRIGPVDRPSEFDDLAGADIAAVFVAGHRHWPDEPLFCHERSDDEYEQDSALPDRLPALGRV